MVAVFVEVVNDFFYNKMIKIWAHLLRKMVKVNFYFWRENWFLCWSGRSFPTFSSISLFLYLFYFSPNFTLLIFYFLSLFFTNIKLAFKKEISDSLSLTLSLSNPLQKKDKKKEETNKSSNVQWKIKQLFYKKV